MGKCPKLSLEEIILRNNLFTAKYLPNVYEEKFKKLNNNITTDVFGILYYLEPERLERSIWIDKGNNDNQNTIYREIVNLEKTVISEEDSHIGIPLTIRTIRGRKTGAKKENIENNAFVEFIMPKSVNRMLKIGNTSKFYLSGVKRNIYKAGTRIDYIIVKKRKYHFPDELPGISPD